MKISGSQLQMHRKLTSMLMTALPLDRLFGELCISP